VGRCVPALADLHDFDEAGVAPDRVRLSWVLTGTGANRAQRACQVLVTADDDTVAWDSGRVESSASADVAYPGEAPGGLVGVVPSGASRAAPLTAGGRYRWKVRVWDEGGLASGWSEPAWFELELDRTSGGLDAKPPPGAHHGSDSVCRYVGHRAGSPSTGPGRQGGDHDVVYVGMRKAMWATVVLEGSDHPALGLDRREPAEARVLQELKRRIVS